jgi:hypothetical protein
MGATGAALLPLFSSGQQRVELSRASRMVSRAMINDRRDEGEGVSHVACKQ